MAKTKKETVAEEVVEVVKSARESIVVTWRGGVREYTKALHGADYLKLAKEFAEKRGGTLA